jgi:hypothetical protein
MKEYPKAETFDFLIILSWFFYSEFLFLNSVKALRDLDSSLLLGFIEEYGNEF